MAIARPTHSHYNHRRRTSSLYFGVDMAGKDESAMTASPVEARMAGGICWPVLVPARDGSGGGLEFEGAVILAGEDIETGLVTIYEQRTFVTVENVLGPDRRIEFHGLAPWFTQVWARYYVRDFYWFQDFELTKRYRLEVFRSQMVMEPKPSFIEVPWSDPREALGLAWKYVKTNRLRFENNSILHQALKTVAPEDRVMNPIIHSLCCLMAGIERFPWRDYAWTATEDAVDWDLEGIGGEARA